MYDDLIESLRLCANNGECLDCVKFKDRINGDDHCNDTLVLEAADAIEELNEIREEQKAQIILSAAGEKPRWIPVTEEPPLKVGDDGYNGYLVYANGYYEVADYTTDKFDNVPYFHVDGEYEPGVTHFMPLPEPPLKGEGE